VLCPAPRAARRALFGRRRVRGDAARCPAEADLQKWTFKSGSRAGQAIESSSSTRARCSRACRRTPRCAVAPRRAAPPVALRPKAAAPQDRAEGHAGAAGAHQGGQRRQHDPLPPALRGARRARRARLRRAPGRAARGEEAAFNGGGQRGGADARGGLGRGQGVREDVRLVEQSMMTYQWFHEVRP
jgi:hypothetical protein